MSPDSVEPQYTDFPGVSAGPDTSGHNLKSILNAVSDGFTAIDRDWRVTYLNQASLELLRRLGKTPEDLEQRSLWEVLPEAVGTRFYDEYQRAMRDHVNVEFEEHYPPLDAWFQVRLFPSSEGILAYTHDVTEAKRNEMALAERTRSLALSAEVGRVLTSTGTLRKMLQGCAEAMVRHCEAAFARIWTINETQVLELQASAGVYTHLTGPHSRIPVGRYKIGRIARDQKPHMTNTVVGDPEVHDQEWARREGMIAFAGYPLCVDGMVVGVAALFARHPLSPPILESLQSISDEIGLGIARKQAEAGLAASQEWLSTTLTSIGDAVIATDRAGEITFMNPVAEEMTGYSQEQARGRPLGEMFRIVNEDSGRTVENPVDRVLAEGRVVGLANHTVLIARDGTRRSIEDSAAPIRGAGSEIEGAVLVFHDVTERRQAERRAAAQYRVSAALASAVSLPEAAESAMEAIGSSLGWKIGHFWVKDENDGPLHVIRTWSAAHFMTERAAEFTHVSSELKFASGEGLPGRVYALGRPEWIEQIENDRGFPRAEIAIAAGIRSALAFPLQTSGERMGVIEFFHTDVRPPDAEMLQTLEGFGQQIGQFIERHRAADEAIRNAALRSAILASALDCIISMDNRGHIVEWNAEAERTFGYSREEVMDQYLADLIIPPALRELHRRGLEHYLKTGEGPVIGKRIEITAMRRGGEEFPVELAISRIAGETSGFTGFIRDITERRKAEREQQRLANYNHLLLQSTGEGIYGVDLQGNCTFLNAAGAEMLKLDPSAMIGKNMHDFTHYRYPDGTNYPQCDCPIYRAFTTGVGCRVDDEVFVRSDGVGFPVEYSSFPIIENHIVQGAVVTFSDITERKRTQGALQSSEARYQRIAANVPGMVYQFVLHPDGSFNFPFVSEFSRELYGIEPEAIQADAQAIIGIIHPDDRPSFQQTVLESAQSLQPWRWTGRFFHSSGEYRWIEGASRPQKEQNGDTVWDGLLLDVTQRKETEVELRQAKEAAEAATVAKSQFLATMSHEIRTPMNAVIGMTGLLLDTPLNPQQQEYAQIIRDSGDALLTVINDILDFSKIEAGQLEVENQPFDLRDTVESALELVAGRAADRGLDIAYVMSPDTPDTVIGDSTRVRQVLVNLISNAVKFTERGEVVISVSSEPLKAGRYNLRFEVRDTGIGIPPERMDRLFRSFSQVDASTTRRYGGTGLGLVISRRLCEIMGGRIWAESEAGVGSKFHVELPVTLALQPVHEPIVSDDAVLKGRRLLIVDDNATNRQILYLQAQNWGMEATECASATEATDRLRRGERFDIAILDIQMPDMDGITLAKEIQSCCGEVAMPLIGLSSVWSRRSDIPEGLFSEMLTKPIKQAHLYSVLASVLSGTPRTYGGAGTGPASHVESDLKLGREKPLRILIAEDLTVNQKLLQALLAKFGYRADVAANGVEVLQALERQPYDLILMDVQMPEMDGLEASRHIHRRYAVRRPWIVALTANAMREDRDACIAAGMDDYLAKPVRPDALRDALARCGMQTHSVEENEAASGRLNGESPPPGSAASARLEPGPVADDAVIEDVIEPIFLRELRSMRDILPDLIETYRREVQPRLDEIRVALHNKDPEALSRAAHGIKGVAGSLGGKRLAALCSELEHLGRSGTVEGAASLMPDVQKEYYVLSVVLDKINEEK